MGLFTQQPFKGVYALSALSFELLRVPIWILKFLTPYGRQHPQWTFRQAFSIRMLLAGIYHVAITQIKTKLPLTPGREKERFIVISAAPGDYYKGPVAPKGDVKPVSIGASWYPAPLTPSSSTSSLTVVLHLHGGAFVVGDGRAAASGYMASKLLKHGGATHVFAPQYRLSSLPPGPTAYPFPAALQDSITAYLYLLNDLKISPKNIVISGDSAGGNLAISVLRYISEYGADLNIPVPSAAWLWSPWIQPSESIYPENLTKNKNYGTDYLSYAFTEWGSYAYAGFNTGEDAAAVKILSDPYISHKDKPFKSETPMWVNTGGAEVLYFDDVKWVEQMRGVEGNNVEIDVEEKAPHDILLVGGQLGFDKEATACAQRAGAWLKRARK